jgi:N-methylhydantoinase A
MGGTSADVSLVDGAPAWRTEARIGDLPIRVPPSTSTPWARVAGRSPAWTPAGRCASVPRARARIPGPACYGRGTAPTVTDANLVLGRLVETEFLGGAMRLDRARAERALAPLARRLGWSPEATAAGIVRVANAVMERAARVITVERGHDPRDFVWWPSAARAASTPPSWRARSASARLRARGIRAPLGVGLSSRPRSCATTRERSSPSRLRARVLRAAFAALERGARRDMRAEGVAHPTLERTLDLRYAASPTS